MIKVTFADVTAGKIQKPKRPPRIVLKKKNKEKGTLFNRK